MNQDQCNELRDLLFAAKFPSYPAESPFRYLAVVPGEAVNAVVHYAYAPPVWDRAGFHEEPARFLSSLLSTTPFREMSIEFQQHEYLRDGWPLPWGLTAKESVDNFPLLALVERDDGSVTGALLRNPHMANLTATIAELWCEPDEVETLIAELRAIEPDGMCFVRELEDGAMSCSAYKECNIDAVSVADAVASTPETSSGQKEVLLYREKEWLSALWNNPASGTVSAGELNLRSVADFHGTRVSAAKSASRPGLDVARSTQTLAGDYAVLEAALLLADEPVGTENFEDYFAVKMLAAWWNMAAPEDSREAAFCRAYHWVPEGNIFIACDPEEPALQADQLEGSPSYALFEQEGRPTVALQFYRGRAFNTEDQWGTVTHYANGDDAASIGLDLDEVDEAYYSVSGLQALRSIVMA